MKCREVFEKIDCLNDEYLDVLEALCNIESPTGYKAGVDDSGRYLISIAEKLGWQTEVYKQAVAGDVVVITMNPESSERAICLSAHSDTVHAVGSFGTPAVRRDEKRMYGPGVLDCKGGLVSAMLAMDSLQKCGYKKRPVRLLVQSDEETGSKTSGLDTIKYICKRAEGAEAFINLEKYEKNKLILKTRGIIRFLFKIKGKARHSSQCFEGANAILEAAQKIIELEKYKDPEKFTCNCGIIKGGYTANSVAEECEFYADFRFSSEKMLEEVKSIAERIADECKVAGCTCVLEQVSYRPAMELTKQNAELTERINQIFKEEGIPEHEPIEFLGGTDAAYITKCGIPCVDGLGTEGDHYHSLDEYIELDSLAGSAKKLAAIIYNL